MNRLHPSFFGAPIAHRGLHDASSGIIENSMSAIRAAIQNGYGIEIDVQPAKDLTPMVFHDYLLDRLTANRGPINSKSAEALGQTKLTGSDDGIPSLAQVLNEIDGHVPLLVEIKDQDTRLGPNVGDFQDKVCEVLADYSGPVAVMSFSPETIARVTKLDPDLSVGLVTDPFKAKDWPDVPAPRREDLAKISDAEALSIDFISHQQTDLTSPAVSRIKKGGLAVFCWTIRNAQDETRARQIADNITFEGYTPTRPE